MQTPTLRILAKMNTDSRQSERGFQHIAEIGVVLIVFG